MAATTRRAGSGARPGILERWFFQPAMSVVVATGLYRHVDPWAWESVHEQAHGRPARQDGEQAPVLLPIPAPRRPPP